MCQLDKRHAVKYALLGDIFVPPTYGLINDLEITCFSQCDSGVLEAVGYS